MEMTAHINEIEVAESDDRERTAKEIEASKRIARMLVDHYPGYMWSVEVNLRGKAKGAIIRLPVLTGPSRGYVIPGHLLASEGSARRAIIRAGGELLERFSIPRCGLNLGLARFLDAKQATLNGRLDIGALDR